jgi:subtilisin family serine protease
VKLILQRFLIVTTILTSQLCDAQTHRIYPPLSHSPRGTLAQATAAAHLDSATTETLIVEHPSNPVLREAVRIGGKGALQILGSSPRSTLERTVITRATLQRRQITQEQEDFRGFVLGSASPLQNPSSISFSSVKNVLNASILSGAAPGTYDRLRSLGFDVRRSRSVRANLAESVPKLGADVVWTQHTDVSGNPITGRGVRVGIIDTGIDYTHPDLGSCTRSQFLSGGCPKVIGGYDFSANDADPMDQHLHGTHVASIVAANSTVRGVAPDAKLYALRVLDQHGSGFTSDIIRAIEWATDPNGDGNFSDHLDIINLSLGADGGLPSDPDSVAVDAASDAGVVVVVAAGNSGPQQNTIGSPGAARKALTVGASTKDDTLADFSSRGPVMDGSITIAKPDFVAPGVSICAAKLPSSLRSSCTDSAHTSLSGTSMAAPHVAGVAALMKQANPLLTPDRVKSILRTTAVKLTENGTPLDRYAQGAGRIDAKAAVALAISGGPSLVASLSTVGAIPSSLTPIYGDATGPDFQRYELYLSSDTTGKQSLISTSASTVQNGVLGSVNAAALPSGVYTLRLVVHGHSSGVEDTSSISIQHLAITSPRAPDVSMGTDPYLYGASSALPIWGTITGDGLTGYTIRTCWSFADSTGCSIPSAATTAPPATPVTDGVLGYLDLTTLPTLRRGLYEVVLSATYAARAPETIKQSFYVDPHLIPGFAPSIVCDGGTPCPTIGYQPIAADITGDGAAETIFTLAQSVHVVDSTGSALPGWPKLLSDSLLTPPSVGDLDNDGSPEIVVQSARFTTDAQVITTVHAFHAEGTTVAGWPYQKQIQYSELQRYVGDFMTIADIDRDGFSEVLLSPIEVLGHTGVPLPSWPTVLPSLAAARYPMFGGMLVADVNNDGSNEVIWSSTNWDQWAIDGSQESVLVVQSQTGVLLSVTHIPALLPTGPIAADVDGDGLREIVSLQRSNTTDTTSIVARAFDATIVPGWPISVPNEFVGDVAFAASLAAADFDGDGASEIVFQSDVNTQLIRLINGTPTAFLPANSRLSGFGSLAIANVDTDPAPEILFVSRYLPQSPLAPRSESDPRSGLLMLVAINHELSLEKGFPLLVPPSAAHTYPFAVADIDGDREEDIVYPSASTLIAFRTGGCANPREPWPVERGGVARLGVDLNESMCTGGSVVFDSCSEHSDADFIDNCQDQCPSTERLFIHPVCGCALGDDDWDQDGTLTCLDGCPDDPNKISPGVCGCFGEDKDLDRNGTIDCLDGISPQNNDHASSRPKPTRPPTIIKRSRYSVTIKVPTSESPTSPQPRVLACVKPLRGSARCKSPRAGRATFKLQRAAYSLYYTWQYSGRSSYRSPRIKILGGPQPRRRRT